MKEKIKEKINIILTQGPTPLAEVKKDLKEYFEECLKEALKDPAYSTYEAPKPKIGRAKIMIRFKE